MNNFNCLSKVVTIGRHLQARHLPTWLKNADTPRKGEARKKSSSTWNIKETLTPSKSLQTLFFFCYMARPVVEKSSKLTPNSKISLKYCKNNAKTFSFPHWVIYKYIRVWPLQHRRCTQKRKQLMIITV